jgi:hypothetical protein
MLFSGARLARGVFPFVFYAWGRPLSAYVRWSLSALLVISGSLGPGMRDRCLGRRDSHADEGAVATQFTSSTRAGTSPQMEVEIALPRNVVRLNYGGSFPIFYRCLRFTAAVLALAGLGIAGVATSYVDFWRGPSPLYFEFFLWPLYAIFAVRGVRAVLVWVARRSSVGDSTIARFSETQRALALCLPLILALGTVGIARAGAPRPRTMFPLPPTETRSVSFLKDQIALSPGRTFRGRVATMEMVNVEVEVD